MSFTRYPELFKVRLAKRDPDVPFPIVFQGPMTKEALESFNKARLAQHREWQKDLPYPDVKVDRMLYNNDGYQGYAIVYRPKDDAFLPAVVFYHGGSFTDMTVDHYDYFCAAVAESSHCVVFNVEYRQTIDVTVPVCYEDCYAGLLEIAKQAPDFGADASRLAIMGDSAGGELAGGISLMARDRKGPQITYQVLIYPGVGYDLEEIDNGNDTSPVLGSKNIIKRAFDDPQDAANIYVSPFLDKNKEKTPPTMFIVGTADYMVHDTAHYAKALIDAGVRVDIVLYHAMPHEFIQFGNEAALDCISVIGEALKKEFCADGQ